MKRWNGWGDDSVHETLRPQLTGFLETTLGPGRPPSDVSFDEALRRVPASRLPDHPGIDRTPQTRLRHARGQSFPDLIATRSGEGLVPPDGVAFPTTTSEVSDLLAFAQTSDVHVIPYGGGTSVAGHVNPPESERPVLTVSLARLNGLVTLDEVSGLATIGAGARGADLEAALRARGFSLGHYPQSFEYSTLGGWVATRSSGQQSLRYGRIEAIFAGGTLVAPTGMLRLPPYPASAAGPDLRQFVLGSEGRAGILTDVTVRVSRLPETERFEAAFFASWPDALDAVKILAGLGGILSMLRLSTPQETRVNLLLAGRSHAARALGAYLRARGIREGACMLTYGLTGDRPSVRFTGSRVHAILRRYGGVRAGTGPGNAWRRGRFRSPYLRNALWDAGYGVDTVETATTWAALPETLAALEHAIRDALSPWGERVIAFTHLSHVYASGSSLYTTFVFRLGTDAADTADRWSALKRAASEAIVGQGATISHHHGVGRDHAPYLVAEKGELGLRAIGAALNALDPAGRLNPGALLDDDA